MKRGFYFLLMRITRLCGAWVFHLIAGAVAAGYFLIRPHQTAISIRFYRALYPEKKRRFHIGCAWRQYLNFTTVYLDRFVLEARDDVETTHEGWEHIEACLARRTGAIILMSHLGNWELAAHLMKRKEKRIRLLLYMGRRAKEQIESIQKTDLSTRGVRIIAVDEDQGSPFDILEGVRFLQSGGIVSMTGDRLWHPDQRFVEATFLNHTIRLPETPHVMAMLSGAPLLIFFSFRTDKNRYHLSLSEPLKIEHTPRRQRAAVIEQSAQRYADLLENALRKNPHQWYHFEPFLEK